MTPEPSGAFIELDHPFVYPPPLPERREEKGWHSMHELSRECLAEGR
jgi:hypothetical protein